MSPDALIQEIQLPQAGAHEEALAAQLDDLKIHTAREDYRLFPAARALTPAGPVLDALKHLELHHDALSSGFAALARRVEGSVSRRVAQTSPVPVILVP